MDVRDGGEGLGDAGGACWAQHKCLVKFTKLNFKRQQ